MVVGVQETVFGVFLVEVAVDGSLEVEAGAEAVGAEDGGLEVLVDLGLDGQLAVDRLFDAKAEVEFAVLGQDLGGEEADLGVVLEEGGELEDAVAGDVEEAVAAHVAAKPTGSDQLSVPCPGSRRGPCARSGRRSRRFRRSTTC